MKSCVLHGFPLGTFGILAVALSEAAIADQITVQPSNPAADTFVYQGLPTFNFSGAPFADILSAGNTADGTNGGHNTDTLVQFDLSSSATGLVPGAQITSATLMLYAVSAVETGFGSDPTPASPITLNVQTLSGSWNAGTVTYGTLPFVTSDVYPSMTQSGVNQWISFDVTSEVDNWLSGAITNNGLLISQASAVDVDGEPAIGVYDSTQGAEDYSTPAYAPELVITVAPEPSTAVLMSAALASAACVLLLRKLRQQQVRRRDLLHREMLRRDSPRQESSRQKCSPRSLAAA
jgi:hypothetical protein